MEFTEITFLPMKKIFEYSNSIEFILLPGYFLKTDYKEFCFSAFLDGQLFIADDRVDTILENHEIRFGALVNLYMDSGEIKVAAIKTLEFKDKPRLGMVYNQGKGFSAVTATKIELYQGQSIVVRGGLGTDKTLEAKKIADGFEANDFKTYRILIGQKNEDSLGENSINIESTGSARYQLNQFFIVLDKLLREIHDGLDCCLVIDSIEKLITLKGTSQRDLRTTLNFTHRLLRFCGNFNKGSLTIVCTTDYSNTKLSKSIAVEVQSFGDAQIFLGVGNGKVDYSRHS